MISTETMREYEELKKSIFDEYERILVAAYSKSLGKTQAETLFREWRSYFSKYGCGFIILKENTNEEAITEIEGNVNYWIDDDPWERMYESKLPADFPIDDFLLSEEFMQMIKSRGRLFDSFVAKSKILFS